MVQVGRGFCFAPKTGEGGRRGEFTCRNHFHRYNSVEPVADSSPEKSFDREWALTLLERAMDQLEKECVAAQKGDLFQSLRPYLTDAGGKTYLQIAADLGISEGAVKVAVHRLRRRFGELVRDQVERTVANAQDVDDELRELFTALS